jgi:hypothetical protein
VKLLVTGLLSQAERFRFVRVDITDRDAMQNVFAREKLKEGVKQFVEWYLDYYHRQSS